MAHSGKQEHRGSAKWRLPLVERRRPPKRRGRPAPQRAATRHGRRYRARRGRDAAAAASLAARRRAVGHCPAGPRHRRAQRPVRANRAAAGRGGPRRPCLRHPRPWALWRPACLRPAVGRLPRRSGGPDGGRAPARQAARPVRAFDGRAHSPDLCLLRPPRAGPPRAECPATGGQRPGLAARPGSRASAAWPRPSRWPTRSRASSFPATPPWARPTSPIRWSSPVPRPVWAPSCSRP